jgi:regulator of nonsense transcripts 2
LQHHDERLQALINTAFFTVKPPPSARKKQAKVYPPLEGYLRYLLMTKLQPSESSVAFASKQLIRFPWSDQSQQCGKLVCKIMLKTCRRGRFKAIEAVASVAAKLRRHKPEVCIRLLDAVLEEFRWSIEHPLFKDQQRTLTIARLLGEMYSASLASGQLVLQQLYTFIHFGHEIPDSLREASEKQAAQQQTEAESEDRLPVFNSTSAISQTIQEDEEVEDAELETQEVEPEAPKPIAVSRHSIYDPRVFSALDPPNSVFRIKLVCTLLEVVSKTIVTRNYLSKIEGFLAAFQRYLFTKTILPTEVEFSLLDTFDLIDSQWRRVMKDLGGKSKQSDGNAFKSLSFPRYLTWLDAHNAVVANEKADAAAENRAQSRLEALADTRSTDDSTIASDILNDDDDLMEDEDDDSMEYALSNANDSLADEHDLDHFSGDEDIEEGAEDEDDQSGGSDDDDDDSEEEDSDDDSDDDDESEEEFDEEAYMHQLEEEAFERELRRLTMDALEKGKAITRGGKVYDSMPTGSQFIKKKQSDSSTTGPPVALGGKQGISFQLLKKGNKGKMEARQFFVPEDTNLAHVATKQDGEAARERDMIKARVLQYEADAAESSHSGGNVYLEQEKLQVIRNRPLSMEDIDRNFGTSGGNLRRERDEAKAKGASSGVRGPSGGRSGGRGGGRFGGRGGRGRGSNSGRTLV